MPSPAGAGHLEAVADEHGLSGGEGDRLDADRRRRGGGIFQRGISCARPGAPRVPRGRARAEAIAAPPEGRNTGCTLRCREPFRARSIECGMKKSMLGLMFLAAACGGEEAATKAPASFAEQAAIGKNEYTNHCASCHGAGGEGGQGPRLVGLSQGALPLDPRPGAVRTTQFRTVMDVASFAVANMPADAPGSLSQDAYWAILAFDLQANGIDLGATLLTPDVAMTLVIPRTDAQ